MKKEQLLALSCIFLFTILGIYLLVSISDTSNAAYYDNTSIESRVNVTNIGPTITQVVLYEHDDGDQASIGLSEGTTELLRCNATINDLNGLGDITAVNATIYDATSYNSSSANDNNYHYFSTTCSNSSINVSALAISCNFSVWYYANNASWNCNVSARDSSNISNTSIDATPPTITQLAALNLSTNLIDFGEMTPGETTTNAGEKNVNVTNTGNVHINLSLDGYGVVDGDNLSMNCTIGNITISNLRYNVTSAKDFDTAMWNLTDEKLPLGIPSYKILQKVDDGDGANLNSTNTTYWKLRIPIGSARGFCNGTVTFSAVV